MATVCVSSVPGSVKVPVSVVVPFSSIGLALRLSPRLDAQAEKILLAQIEDFRPDLVLNQDTFHIDTATMRTGAMPSDSISAAVSPTMVSVVKPSAFAVAPTPRLSNVTTR